MATYFVDYPIAKVDCNLESDIGPIIIIATTDGMVKVLGTQELNLICEINVKEILDTQITAI